MFKISVRGNFAAAHYVRGYRGDCGSSHGHNFTVEVVIICHQLNKIDIAFDFRRLKKRLNQILKLLDHKDLNRLRFFRRHNPTAEMIAYYIYLRLKKMMPRVKIESVSIWESDENRATYAP